MRNAADLRVDVFARSLREVPMLKIVFTLLAVLGIVVGSASIAPTYANYQFPPTCSTCTGG
jgi:hypothetical protein